MKNVIDISDHTLVHEDVKSILHGFPSNSHPMGVLSSTVAVLAYLSPTGSIMKSYKLLINILNHIQ